MKKRFEDPRHILDGNLPFPVQEKTRVDPEDIVIRIRFDRPLNKDNRAFMERYIRCFRADEQRPATDFDVFDLEDWLADNSAVELYAQTTATDPDGIRRQVHDFTGRMHIWGRNAAPIR